MRTQRSASPTVAPPRPEALGPLTTLWPHTQPPLGATTGCKERTAFRFGATHPSRAPCCRQRPRSPPPNRCSPSRRGSLRAPARRDGRAEQEGVGGGGTAGGGAPAGQPHSPMSVFRHWPEAVSQIRLQRNRHSGDHGPGAHFPTHTLPILTPRPPAPSVSAPRGDSGGGHERPAPHPGPPARPTPRQAL